MAIAEHLADKLKQAGRGYTPVEGKQTGDWVLVDAGDVVVHVFRPEPRAFYALEKMWALEAEAAEKPVKKAAAKRAAPKTAGKPAVAAASARRRSRSPPSAAPRAGRSAISTTTMPAASAGR